MRNWYKNYIKVSQAIPDAGKATEEIRVSMWNEKKVILGKIIDTFIQEVGPELKTRNLDDLMNVTNPTQAMQKAIQSIVAQIDTTNVLVQQTNILLQHVSGEVANTILKESARGNRTGMVGNIINSTKSPIREQVDEWMKYYKVPDEEIEQIKQKQGII